MYLLVLSILKFQCHLFGEKDLVPPSPAIYGWCDSRKCKTEANTFQWLGWIWQMDWLFRDFPCMKFATRFWWKIAQFCTICTWNFWEILRTVIIYISQPFIWYFLRIRIMNPKNCPDNRWGFSVPVSNYYPTLKYFIYNRFVEESFFLSFKYTWFFAGSFLVLNACFIIQRIF